MTMTSLGRVALLAGASLLALGTVRAHAQTLNYGELEQLFGEPVTTSATGKPQKASDVPANMEIITQDEIRRSGADNIPDILRFVTGIDVRRYSFGEASVSVRGDNTPDSPRLLVLLNGRQVYLDDYGYVEWQTIPVELDEIRQIEVVKGPASALYGFNAVGGVINIITYDPLNDKINTITGRTGTQALQEGSVVTTFRATDAAGMRISAGGYRAHEFAFPDNPQPSIHPLNPERGSLSADGRAIVAPGVELDLNASAINASDFEEGGSATYPNEHFNIESIGASGSADTAFGTVRLGVYHNTLNFAGQFQGAGPTTDWVNGITVVQASDLVKLSPDHTVRVALEYRDNNLTSGPNNQAQGGYFGGQLGYQVFAGSAMWNWEISPSLSLTNAVRVDYVTLNRAGYVPPGTGFTNATYDNHSFAAPSFNSGLVYKITDADTVRLMAARGVQLPTLVDYGLEFQLGPVIASGNPLLQVSSVYNYEIDYDRTLQPISSVLRTALYFQRTDNVLSGPFGTPIAIGPQGNILELSQNIGYSTQLGLELGIRGHNDSGLRWNASYALADVNDHLTVNHGAEPTDDIAYQRGTPTSAVVAGAGYSWNKFELDVQAKWQSRFIDYHENAPNTFLVPVYVSDFVTANVRLGYRIVDNVTAAVSVEQLNQNRIVETAGPPVERRVIASLTAHF